MKKSKKSPKLTKSKCQPKPKAKATAKPPVVADQNNPYRVGTAYHVLFAEGSRDYIDKNALIKKVADLTGKSETTTTGYNFNVLKAKSHRSNGGRSTLLIDDHDKNLVKFIALKRPPKF